MGTVQFLPTLEKHHPTSGKHVPVLSLGRGGVPVASDDEKAGLQSAGSPFLPATAMIRPHREKYTPPLTKRNLISRDSSFYSTSSLTTLKCDQSLNPAGIVVLDQDSSPHVQDMVVLEPDVSSFHRLSPISR
jgi:hypothetical protein